MNSQKQQEKARAAYGKLDAKVLEMKTRQEEVDISGRSQTQQMFQVQRLSDRRDAVALLSTMRSLGKGNRHIGKVLQEHQSKNIPWLDLFETRTAEQYCSI